MSVPDFYSLLDEEESSDIFEKQPSQKQTIAGVQTSTAKHGKKSLDFYSFLDEDESSDISEPAKTLDFYSFLDEDEKAKPSATPYDVSEYTPEQLKALSPAERLQYAKDLTTEREYRQSKGFIKGGLSGATFGLSEKIPGLAPEEGDFLIGFGEFLGSTLPITKLYNVLGKPIVSLAAKSPVMAQGLQSFARMTGFGITGAAYEGSKETIKTGEVPSAEELAKYGLQWAAFDGALQLAGKAISASFAKGLKRFSQENGISEKEALNTVMDTLEKEKIDPSKSPEEAIARAEEIIGTKMEKGIEPEKVLSEVESAKFEMRPAQMSIEKTPTPKEIEPIIETTGKGAAERIEYPKTGIEKLIDKGNEFIQAAKTPAGSLKRLGEYANESIFDAIAPLERIEAEIPIAERASTRIRLAQTAASEINSVLENGIFSNVTGNFEHQGLKGAYGDLTWKKLSKGLKEGEYSLQDLDTYRASKVALRRQAEGKKTGIDTQKAMQDINKLQKKYGPIDKKIRDFQKATLEFYGKDLLGKDLIGQWNQKYYAPLFRVMDSGKDSILRTGSLTPKQPFKKMLGSERKIIPPSESDPYNASMLISNAKKNDAILQYRKLVHEGKLPGKIIPTKNDPIPPEVLKELDIDPKLNKVAESLYNQTRKDAYTPHKNTLRGWKDGKPFNIEVPEKIYNVFSSITPQDRGALAKTFSFFNRIFSKSISFEPRKFTSIVGRDALSSLIYSRTGENPISIPQAIGDIFGGKQVYKEFLSMGGDVYASRLAERIDRAKKIEDLISPGKKGILVPFEKMGDYFRKYGKTLGDISLSVPLAEYKRALAVYGNTAEGRIMAAMEARRVTYDPMRKGSWTVVRELGNYIPFWNVSLQDLAMVGRGLKTPEAWIKGFTGITIPTLLLKAANEGNPEYQDLTPVDKAAFWHLYFGDKHVRIPIPWLLGTTFKVSAETFYDTVMELASKGDPRAKDAWKGLYHNFTDNLSGDLPPLLQNYFEMTTGKTAPSPLGTILGTESRAPEVVPRRLQDLPEYMQATAKTSQLARWFGEHWGISPVKLDKTIKTYGGLVAADVLALTDEIAYATGLAEDKRPEQRETNYLLLGHFVSNSPPSRTKYANEFYEELRKATQNKNAQRIIQEKGITDESLDNIDHSGVAFFSYNRHISKLFKQMRAIENSDRAPSLKKRELDFMQRQINDLYKQAIEEVRENRQFAKNKTKTAA